MRRITRIVGLGRSRSGRLQSGKRRSEFLPRQRHRPASIPSEGHLCPDGFQESAEFGSETTADNRFLRRPIVSFAEAGSEVEEFVALVRVVVDEFPVASPDRTRWSDARLVGLQSSGQWRTAGGRGDSPELASATARNSRCRSRHRPAGTPARRSFAGSLGRSPR